MLRRLFLLFAFAILLGGFSVASAQETETRNKQPLNHEAYEIWNQVHTSSLSDDGQWVLYVLGPENGDDTLRIATADGNHLLDVPRGGTDAQFTADSRHVVSRIKPPKDSTKKADQEEADQAPNDSLALADLESGEPAEVTRIADVESYTLPEEPGGLLAYKHATADTTDSEEEDSADEQSGEDGTSDNGSGREDAGSPVTLRNLDTGGEDTFEHVTSFQFTEDGKWLIFARATPDSTRDGVYVVSTETGAEAPVLTGPGTYSDLTLAKDSRQIAFLTNRGDVEADTSEYVLYRAMLGEASEEARDETTADEDASFVEDVALVADATTSGVPEGGWVSEHGSVSFSEDGRHLFFGTSPRPTPDTTAKIEGEPVDVNVWHWEDPRPQTVQVERRESELKRTYQAVAHLEEDDQIVQLATEEMPNLTVGNDGNAEVAVSSPNVRYRKRMSWDYPTYRDIYLVDLQTGDRRLVQEEVQSRGRLSPNAQQVLWWDRENRNWMSQSVERGSETVNLTEGVPHPVHNERHDRPYDPPPYGLAGWTEGDRHVLLYDRHDIWRINPSDPEEAEAITGGTGRDQNLRFRYVDLNPEKDAIDLEEPLLLSSFHYESKATGYHRAGLDGNAPEKLIMEDRHFSSLEKAKDASRLLFQRESYEEFPDLWTANLDFEEPQRISQANPQQEHYRWGTAERVTWTSLTGEPLEGILYKPEGFDPDEEYPMMVYFYERNADNLNRHRAPAPHRSIINVTFYASRGYVVFVPDIVYEEGYPGQSAYNSIMPGVTSLVNQGFVDEDRIGVQGHSWGGYQIAYLVTRTDLFAAAEAGAPVANMTSAYGGIRWGSGRSRMFQYERTQSRIGGSLWEYPKRYLENSPLFEADRIDTPLLMMHNDEDGAVPQEQGLELFLALRRLEKPAWLIDYSGQPHWPTEYHLKVDWQKRMQQFFDHYLKDAPAPRWLEEGIPATEKGRTLGFEPAEPVTEQ